MQRKNKLESLQMMSQSSKAYMFTVDELLSKKNQKLAFEHLATKDGCGLDGMRVSELPKYWKANGQRIAGDIRKGKYEPGIVLMREIVNNKGKRRIISSLPALDRFITRLLSQKLDRYLSPMFFDNSFAYQKDKGITEAMILAKQYINDGNAYLAEIDLKDFFDSISLQRMESLLGNVIDDKMVFQLIHKYLHCFVSDDGKITQKTIGIVQGSPMSPILSNLYLLDLDQYMQKEQYHWMRYADNIYIFSDSYEESVTIYNNTVLFIEQNLNINVNRDKSGVFKSFERKILGYDFVKKGKEIDIQKHQYKVQQRYSNWHDAKLESRNGVYHIVSDGILNKQDFGLLFENEEKKCYIPVEVTDQINVYSNITIAPNVHQLLSNRGIRLCFFDKNGNLQGTYYPRKSKETVSILAQQVRNIADEKERARMAQNMELAGIHNLQINLKYYGKQSKELKKAAETMNQYIVQIKQAASVEQMLIIEARARQLYYQMFNQILQDDDFSFRQRSKQPPKDALNACISFGNTLLYNFFASLCWKKGINPRFGIIHYSERREQSLNFDFADIFKPVITDRVIFSLVNKKMLNLKTCFEKRNNGGVFLTPLGKKIFLEAFQNKLLSRITIKDRNISYRQLLENEVSNYKKYLQHQGKYKPYRHH